MTITSKVISVPIDTKIADFLHNYAGYSYPGALRYVQEEPSEARELAEKIRKSIMDDKSITENYKSKMLES